MSLNLSKLNPNQKEAVLHAEGPLLVLAGAGSGKTNTMAHRIAHLVAARYVPGSAILGLSFTNKAAKELKERVKGLVTKVAGKSACRGLTITTFHSLCVRILRAHGEKIGFQKNFTIVDQNDQGDILRQVLRNIKIDERRFDPDVILFEIGQAKNRFLTPEAAEAFFLESGRVAQDYALAAASAFGKYQDQLKALNAMDFDDLLYNAVKLLTEHADARKFYNDKFRYILVDEYQDTNPAQFKLLRALTEHKQNLCVVGDDDQSIYSWRGADSAHILKFTKQFPAARVITLDQNYRSTSTILDAANRVIEANSHRHPKRLWSDRGQGEPITQIVLEEDRQEAEVVATEILDRAKAQTRPWKDFAILYRSNAQSRIFEEALRRHQIPYKIVGGMSFLERKEIKDVLSYWRLFVNPKDDASLRRVLNWPARGVGKSSIEALGTYAFQNGFSFFEALSEAPRLVPRGAAGAIAFRDLILDLRRDLASIKPEPAAMADWGKRSLERIQARKAIEDESDDPVQAARRWENVEELVNSIGLLKVEDMDVDEEEIRLGTFNGTGFLREFLARMALEAQDDDDKDKDKDKERDQAILLTLHGAKGLEYPVVFMVGMEEGFLPHKRTIEEATDFSEERRLCYVGITRARDHLIITRAKNRIRFGKPVPRYPSRFLTEIPKELIVTKDLSMVPDFDSDQAREQHESQVKNFLADIRSKIGPPKPGLRPKL